MIHHTGRHALSTYDRHKRKLKVHVFFSILFWFVLCLFVTLSLCCRELFCVNCLQSKQKWRKRRKSIDASADSDKDHKGSKVGIGASTESISTSKEKEHP